jgi:hypothetical protein
MNKTVCTKDNPKMPLFKVCRGQIDGERMFQPKRRRQRGRLSSSWAMMGHAINSGRRPTLNPTRHG